MLVVIDLKTGKLMASCKQTPTPLLPRFSL